ncbi:hypothetical protein [Mycolicibacterium thermoresistibile]|nr:hypothetical protein [Mycolicibacterium thermoresistibile]MCV7191157.1 hypothetical protein [Mycolicibacterium thermoresistibile]GAT15494.1 putative uncharacterized protein [Mycolicibacterium thermoresistibile]SNW16954.1 Uncharacterised protein [Mycolicibacterium thermoresistibile]
MTAFLRAAPAAGMGGADCERLVDAVLAQPVLAVTSLAYLIAAGLVLTWAVPADSLLAGTAGVVLLTVGIDSFAYHGPQPSWAQPAHDWPILAVAVVYTFALLRTGRRRWRVWAGAGAVFALAVAAHLAGRTGSPLCSPDSWWQWHGVWHVLSATAAASGARAMVRPG